MEKKNYKFIIESEGIRSNHYVSIDNNPCLSEADRCNSLEYSLSCQLNGKPFNIIEKNEL